MREDRLPRKLSVVTSNDINKTIEAIDTYNQDNEDGLFQWHNYLDGIRNYISNPVIAWDYMGRYSHFTNGAIFIRDFDYNVGLIVKVSKITHQAYVYVFRINLNPEEFGLKVPPTLNENAQSTTKIVYHLKESQLRRIIRESISRILDIA